MINPDREQLKHTCADALEALHRDQRVDRIAGWPIRSRRSGPHTASMGS
jgi:hypothetical protein